jgi:hypothetical protein
VRDVAGQEGDTAGLQLVALVADPDRHGAALVFPYPVCSPAVRSAERLLY